MISKNPENMKNGLSLTEILTVTLSFTVDVLTKMYSGISLPFQYIILKRPLKVRQLKSLLTKICLRNFMLQVFGGKIQRFAVRY